MRATDAAAGPAAPPPAARLRAPRLQRLYPEDPIRVSVCCAAACDVRVFVPEDGVTSAGSAATLVGEGSKTLGLYPTGGGDGAVPRRRGRSIVVTWRTAFPARRVEFNVSVPAAPGTPNFGEPAAATGRGRTHFRLTLRPPRPRTVRRVVIAGFDLKGLHKRSVTVSVTG